MDMLDKLKIQENAKLDSGSQLQSMIFQLRLENGPGTISMETSKSKKIFNWQLLIQHCLTLYRSISSLQQDSNQRVREQYTLII